MRLSIITPAFNEAGNLETLHARLVAVMDTAGVDWEWLIVDDHSSDTTFEVIRRLTSRDPRVSGVRLARNSGSHTAIGCGLHHVTGDAAVALAADLQDPPEMIPALLEPWRAGAQVVWAVRGHREDASPGALGFAQVYYFIMRRLAGLKQMPASGVDSFLVDRSVVDAFRNFREQHVSVFALLLWMGFRQAFVEYDKQPRHSGRSGWSLAKKTALVIDSVTAFSPFPIRWCSFAGAGLILAAPIVAVTWHGLAALVVGLSGLQLLAVGIVGEYVWRALQDARQRPAYLVEATSGRLAGGVAGALRH